MNICLDRFFEFIEHWSVGRMVALLDMLAWITFIVSTRKFNVRVFFLILLISVFLEIIELLHNKMIIKKDDNERVHDKAICLFSSIIFISFIVLLFLSFYCLWVLL